MGDPAFEPMLMLSLFLDSITQCIKDKDPRLPTEIVKLMQFVYTHDPQPGLDRRFYQDLFRPTPVCASLISHTNPIPDEIIYVHFMNREKNMIQQETVQEFFDVVTNFYVRCDFQMWLFREAYRQANIYGWEIARLFDETVKLTKPIHILKDKLAMALNFTQAQRALLCHLNEDIRHVFENEENFQHIPRLAGRDIIAKIS
jgi:hypothetical protein